MATLATLSAVLAMPRRATPTALAADAASFITPALAPATRLSLLLQSQSVTTEQLAFIINQSYFTTPQALAPNGSTPLSTPPWDCTVPEPTSALP